MTVDGLQSFAIVMLAVAQVTTSITLIRIARSKR